MEWEDHHSKEQVAHRVEVEEQQLAAAFPMPSLPSTAS